MESRLGAGFLKGDEEMARKMRAYGEGEHGGKYVLDDFDFSRNHTKAVTVRRWKRNLKKKARKQNKFKTMEVMV